MLRVILVVSYTLAGATPLNITFGADRYPTGAQECSWLNWIADRLDVDDMKVVKQTIIWSVDSLGSKTWASIGNGVLTETVFEDFRAHISASICARNRTLVKACTGLSDIGCRFKDFASNDSSVIFTKTDGAVASPPNHKVVAENDHIRVVNVYCPPGELEMAFHTHTRLSFWLSYGVPRGEIYHAYDGSIAFDSPLWDQKAQPKLSIAWNGPEWFHLLEEKERGSYWASAPGNCPVDIAPNCSNGFKYRVELKLDPALDNYGLSLVRFSSVQASIMV